MRVPLKSTGIFTETETVGSSSSPPGKTSFFATVDTITTTMATPAVVLSATGFVPLSSTSVLITIGSRVKLLTTAGLARSSPFRIHTTDVGKLFGLLIGWLNTLLRSGF